MKRRYYDIDLGRVLCLIRLPLIHVTEFWGIEDSCGGFLVNQFNDAFYYPCFIMTAFVAPMFMLVMGISMCFSSKNTPKDYLLRGLFLLITELIFNAVRYALPGFIGIIFSPNNDVRIEVLTMIGYGMINSDILAFAGLTFIVFALFKKLKLNPIAILAVSLSLYLIDELLIANLLSPVMDQNLHFMVNNLFGNFIYINGDSTFALLQWLIVPAIGYAFGHYCLVDKEEKAVTRSYAVIVVIGALLAAAAISVGILVDGRSPLSIFSHNVNRTRLDWICLITNVAICFGILFLCNLLYKAKRVRNAKKFNAFISRFSKNTNGYYIAQWTIVGFAMFICGGVGLWGSHNTHMTVGIVGILVITVVSYFLAPLVEVAKKKLRLER